MKKKKEIKICTYILHNNFSFVNSLSHNLSFTDRKNTVNASKE